jgi:CheY-like chemotaxis protein
MEQVILNLALNARDAMTTGGLLTIETQEAVIDEGSCHGHADCRPGRFVRVSVSDTGCGMSAEVRSHLFEPFFTTKPTGKGTGLGLATVYGIVRGSGGFISVHTERGKGTTFDVYLPALASASKLEEPEADVRPRRRGSETVLLVEDEAEVRRVVRRVLETDGYDVLEAGCGADALSLIDQHRGPIDLVLSDIVMPEMNGRELATKVLERRPGCRVLLMSGYFDDGANEGEETAISDRLPFLQKPFSLDGLAKKVREVLDRTS